MDIQALKLSLASVMPILDANLGSAHREYMAGDIAAGAFHYVRSRHETALGVLSRDDLNPQAAYKACASLAVDLRNGLRDQILECPVAHSQVQAWWQCYRDAGFTDINEFFDAPMLPLPASADAAQVDKP